MTSFIASDESPTLLRGDSAGFTSQELLVFQVLRLVSSILFVLVALLAMA